MEQDRSNAGQGGEAITGPLSTQDVPPELRPQGSPYSNPGEPTRQWSQPSEPVPQQPPYGVPADYTDRRRGRPYSRGVLGPLLLILVGTLFLLSNFGIVNWSIWLNLWRLWPLILVAIGLELLVGRRNPVLSVIILLLLVAATVAFLATGISFSGPGDLRQAVLDVPMIQAKSANITIELGSGELNVDSLDAETNRLASGTLEYYDNEAPPTHTLDPNSDPAYLTLSEGQSHGGFPFFGHGRAITWDVHLSPKVPIDLTVKSGAGKTDLDLERLQVRSTNVQVGAGTATVIFPDKVAGTLQASVATGTGNLEIEIPEDLEARIQANAGLGNTNVDNRFQKSGNIYQSAGYDTAQNKLDLTVQVGAGNVNVNSK
jgi:hypothetical protein